MSIERQKMLAGEMYDPFDPELVAGRARARDLCQQLNATRESEEVERRRILRDLFGKGGNSVWMQPPFYDLAQHIEVSEIRLQREVQSAAERLRIPEERELWRRPAQTGMVRREGVGKALEIVPVSRVADIRDRPSAEQNPEAREPRRR